MSIQKGANKIEAALLRLCNAKKKDPRNVNTKNNKQSNLHTLCPNSHSQTTTCFKN